MNSRCQITICGTATGYLFRLMGRGTLRESPTVRDFVSGALADGADVVMDLSCCEYLDSTFLGCLLILHREGEQTQGSFALFADEPIRRTLFGASRLDRVLQFTTERPECTSDPVTLQLTNLNPKELCRHLLAAHRKLVELGGPSAETFQRVVERLQSECDQLPP